MVRRAGDNANRRGLPRCVRRRPRSPQHRAEDRMAEAYALVMLVEEGCAYQNDVGRALCYANRTLRRYQERFDAGGLQALGKTSGRTPGKLSVGKVDRLRDRTILRLKTEGSSNRMIGYKLGLDEKAIRKRLRRLGWKPPDKQLALSLLNSSAPTLQRSGSPGEAVANEGSQNLMSVESDGNDPGDEHYQEASMLIR